MFLHLVNFSAKLLAILLFAFGIHILALYARKLPLFEDHIILSYVLNFILAALIYLFVLQASKKPNAQAGFVFVFGSALKFVVFLLVLKPLYKGDGVISLLEIAAFFVPYFLALLFEVFSLSKHLNTR